MKTVLITYNSVGRELKNGIYSFSNNSLIVLQGFIRKTESGPDLHQKRVTLVQLWRELCQSIDLRSVDLFVVYCGKIPETAINLVAGIQPQKTLFLHCGCGWIENFHYTDFVMDSAGWLKTKCGGIEEMLNVYEKSKKGEIQDHSCTLGSLL